MTRDTKLKFVREVYGVAKGSPKGTDVRVDISVLVTGEPGVSS